MTNSLPIPYKSQYSLAEFWAQLTQGTLWHTYARDNPKEAEALELHAKRKIAQEADFVPANLTHTFTGNSILIVILSLH